MNEKTARSKNGNQGGGAARVRGNQSCSWDGILGVRIRVKALCEELGGKERNVCRKGKLHGDDRASHSLRFEVR